MDSREEVRIVHLLHEMECLVHVGHLDFKVVTINLATMDMGSVRHNMCSRHLAPEHHGPLLYIHTFPVGDSVPCVEVLQHA